MKNRNLKSTVSISSTAPARSPSECRGFTLLEVIVALGIVAVGILGVARAMNGYVDTTAALEQRVVAGWVAANRLEYLRITKAIPVAGETRGSDQMGGRTWYLKETTTATADPLLFRIDISVYTDSELTEQAGRLTGYLLNTKTETGTDTTGAELTIDSTVITSFWTQRSGDPESNTAVIYLRLDSGLHPKGTYRFARARRNDHRFYSADYSALARRGSVNDT
jgi:general secretion pathway protein I